MLTLFNKNYFRQGLFLIPIVVVLLACSRDQPADPDINNENDGSLLSAFIELDTLRTSGSDTVQKYKLDYDPSKRLNRFTQFGYDTLTGSLTYIAESNFLYNGPDTLPHKIVANYTMFHPSGSISNQYTVPTNCFYNAKGFMTRSVAIVPNMAGVDSIVIDEIFDITDTFARRREYYNGLPLPVYDSIETQMYILHHNVWSPSLRRLRVRDNITYLAMVVHEYSYAPVYDNYKNPFRPLRILYTTWYFPVTDAGFFGRQLISANNIVSDEYRYYYNFSYASTITYNVNYTYNSKGFPVAATYKRSRNGNQFSAGKKLFYYTD